MSLLDGTFDLSYEDVIRSQVIEFLKNDSNITSESINLVKGFFQFLPGKVQLVKYDNDPINWKILSEGFTNNFYIVRNPNYNIISEYGLNEILIKTDLGYFPLTLKLIFSKKIKDFPYTLYINM